MLFSEREAAVLGHASGTVAGPVLGQMAILVMASAMLGWLGGLVAWLLVLGALAVFAYAATPPLPPAARQVRSQIPGVRMSLVMATSTNLISGPAPRERAA